MSLHDQKIDGVPQFVSYFVPVITLHDTGVIW